MTEAHNNSDDFDHWQKHQSDITLRMDIVQQAGSYAADNLWHDRVSDTEYVFESLGMN